MARERGSASAAGHGAGLRRKARWALSKGWRPFAFLLIVLVAIGAGLCFKDLSNPGEESQQFASEELPSFNVFVSNPNASVKVNVHVFCDVGPRPVPCTTHSSTAQATLAVSPVSSSSGIVLITSNFNYSGRDAASALPFSRDGLPPGNARIYEDEIPLGQATSKDVLTVNIPNVVEEAGGSVFGRLPVIGNLESKDLWPSMLAEYHTKGSGPEDVIYHPVMEPWAQNNRLQVGNPEAYETLHGGKANLLFWNPDVLSVSENLDDITGVVSTQQVDYMTPLATVSGMAYSWNADNLLQPQFKSTDPQASSSQTEDAFIAGILLGIAGAAVIAFLQELPPHNN